MNQTIPALGCTLLLLLACRTEATEPTSPKIKLSPLEPLATASYRGMAVASKQTAWATGSMGAAFNTSDAGKSWQRVTVPGADELDFRDVAILPDGTVLLMSAGSGDLSRVFRSTDDGKTWRVVLANTDADGFFDGFDFDSNGKNGLLYGDPLAGRLDLYQTVDGGATWTRLPTEQRPRLNEGEYGFAASGSGIVVHGPNVWIATGGTQARILHSKNLGKSWQGYTTPIRSGNESSGIFSLDFRDAQTGIVIGGDYLQPNVDTKNTARTKNGGQTWDALANVRMPHKACVRWLAKDCWLACGRTGVTFTPDGGQTWQQITTDSYYSLDVDRESGTGFLVGKDGRLARFQVIHP